MKFAYARLVTQNVAALAQFYQQVTGIIPVGSDDYVEFHTSGGTLSISSKRSVDLFNAGAAEPAANHSAIVEFEVDDVDRERARLDGKIQNFVLEPTDQPWGNRSMLFRDPDGTLINFFSRKTIPACKSTSNRLM